jgi:hypothetical protein
MEHDTFFFVGHVGPIAKNYQFKGPGITLRKNYRHI